MPSPIDLICIAENIIVHRPYAVLASAADMCCDYSAFLHIFVDVEGAATLNPRHLVLSTFTSHGSG